MKTTRILLPFTRGMDMDVLEHAVQFAYHDRATLVPLALLHLPEQHRSKGPRLEAVQQAKDFLEAVRYKAERVHVAVEQCETVTPDTIQSIHAFSQAMACDGILLFLQGNTPALLSSETMQNLLEQANCRLYLVRLQSQKKSRSVPALLRRYADRLFQRPGPRMENLPQYLQALSDSEVTSLVKAR